MGDIQQNNEQFAGNREQFFEVLPRAFTGLQCWLKTAGPGNHHA